MQFCSPPVRRANNKVERMEPELNYWRGRCAHFISTSRFPVFLVAIIIFVHVNSLGSRGSRGTFRWCFRPQSKGTRNLLRKYSMFLPSAGSALDSMFFRFYFVFLRCSNPDSERQADMASSILVCASLGN
jgi:hypothetical protein